jgi:hypothetical protein
MVAGREKGVPSGASSATAGEGGKLKKKKRKRANSLEGEPAVFRFQPRTRHRVWNK